MKNMMKLLSLFALCSLLVGCKEDGDPMPIFEYLYINKTNHDVTFKFDYSDSHSVPDHVIQPNDTLKLKSQDKDESIFIYRSVTLTFNNTKRVTFPTEIDELKDYDIYSSKYQTEKIISENPRHTQLTYIISPKLYDLAEFIK